MVRMSHIFWRLFMWRDKGMTFIFNLVFSSVFFVFVEELLQKTWKDIIIKDKITLFYKFIIKIFFLITILLFKPQYFAIYVFIKV